MEESHEEGEKENRADSTGSLNRLSKQTTLKLQKDWTGERSGGSQKSGIFDNSVLMREVIQNQVESTLGALNPFDFYHQILMKKNKKKSFESADKSVRFKEEGRLEMKLNENNWNIQLDFREKENLKKQEAKDLFMRIKNNNFKAKKDFRNIKNSKQSYKDYVEMKSEYAIKKFKDLIKEMKSNNFYSQSKKAD